MRNMMKKIALLALAMMLCFSAMAAEFSMDKTGSITLTIQTAQGVKVENAVIELYRVGDPKIENAALKFELTGEFAETGVSLSDLNAAGLADALAAAAKNPVASATTGADGVVKFDDLSVGLYLVKQNGFAAQMYFSEIAPFIITIPMTNAEGNGWDYDIEAGPKVNVLPKPTATPAPTTTAKPDASLPQTGMLRWPIPVMGVCGLVLFSLGWALCFMKKNSKDA